MNRKHTKKSSAVIKGTVFPTGFGFYEIVKVKGKTVYAIREGTTYNSIKDFNVTKFTKREVQNYIQYQ